MILSNEPGYYKDGAYGIRIENLILVTRTNQDPEKRGFLQFENLTWAPIDQRLIDPSLLSDQEKQWLNDYHAAVYEKISPLVDDDVKNWLKKATKSL